MLHQDYNNFAGYTQTARGMPDSTLVETSAGKIMGELLRRYWHPIFIADDLKDRPCLIKVMAEELVLFKDGQGRIGLVHKNCPHRRASLEYGRIAERGIRCCYHGWHFDIDGSILDIPGQPGNPIRTEKVKQNCRLGAYPTYQFKGLIFAYLGPTEHIPAFPHFDAYDIPDMVMTPYKAHFKCNWIQVLDAIVDPIHTAFLHQDQFTDGFGTVGEYQFYPLNKLHFLGTATRRVGEHAWVRVNELILPNFTQSGAAFSTDGTQLRYFGRSSFTRWVVPVDDENCIAYAWGNFGERGDPLEYNTRSGMERMEQGAPIDRPLEDKLRNPGDLEAVEGMGRISDHSHEHLVAADRGVMLYRTQLKKLCRSLEKGESCGLDQDKTAGSRQPLPMQSDLGKSSMRQSDIGKSSMGKSGMGKSGMEKSDMKQSDMKQSVIHTYGSDSVIPLPRGDNLSTALQSANDQVMDILFAGDQFNGEARDRFIIEKLAKL